MNLRHRALWVLPLAFALCLPRVAVSSQAAPAGSARQERAEGLRTLSFGTLHGQVIVNLPDDMAAGDRISGTVETRPAGQTPEDKARNQLALDRAVLELAGAALPLNRPWFSWTAPVPRPGAAVRYQVRVLDAQGGAALASTVVTPEPPGSRSGSAQPPPGGAAPSFSWPAIGQQGHAIEIQGPFDGDLGNTSVAVGGHTVRVLAESPRKCVFESPGDIAGQTSLALTEGAAHVTGNYRNVGVRLSAPKTTLLRGERTDVQLDVSGLEGLRTDLPAAIVVSGPVALQGGNTQTHTIPADQIKPDGTYAMPRPLTLTGQQAGSFSVTATVVTTGAGRVVASGAGAQFKDAGGAPGKDACADLNDQLAGLDRQIADKKKELNAAGDATRSQDELNALEKELAKLQRDRNTLANKVRDGSATEQQLDDARKAEAAKRQERDAKKREADTLAEKARDVEKRKKEIGDTLAGLQRQREELVRQRDACEKKAAEEEARRRAAEEAAKCPEGAERNKKALPDAEFDLMNEGSTVSIDVFNDKRGALSAAENMADFWKTAASVLDIAKLVAPGVPGKTPLGLLSQYLKQGGDIVNAVAAGPLGAAGVRTVTVVLRIGVTHVTVPRWTVEVCHNNAWVTETRCGPETRAPGVFRRVLQIEFGDENWLRISKGRAEGFDAGELNKLVNEWAAAQLAALEKDEGDYKDLKKTCK